MQLIIAPHKQKKQNLDRLFVQVVTVFKMIEGYGAVTQALLGTLLTWGLTAAGAGLVVFLRGNHVSCESLNQNFY